MGHRQFAKPENCESYCESYCESSWRVWTKLRPEILLRLGNENPCERHSAEFNHKGNTDSFPSFYLLPPPSTFSSHCFFLCFALMIPSLLSSSCLFYSCNTASLNVVFPHKIACLRSWRCFSHGYFALVSHELMVNFLVWSGPREPREIVESVVFVLRFHEQIFPVHFFYLDDSSCWEAANAGSVVLCFIPVIGVLFEHVWLGLPWIPLSTSHTVWLFLAKLILLFDTSSVIAFLQSVALSVIVVFLIVSRLSTGTGVHSHAFSIRYCSCHLLLNKHVLEHVQILEFLSDQKSVVMKEFSHGDCRVFSLYFSIFLNLVRW